MPAPFAYEAEGKVAVFADGEAFRHGNVLGFGFGLLAKDGLLRLGFRLKFREVVHGIFWLGVLLAASWSLTPLAGAINCTLVRLKTLLSFQADIPLHNFLLQWNLQKLTWVQGPITLSSLCRSLGVHTFVFTAYWVQTLDAVNVALVDAVIVEVLQTGRAKDMMARDQSVTLLSLLRLKADTAVKSLGLEDLASSLQIVIKQDELDIAGHRHRLVATHQTKRGLCLLL
jgi:hypothetical protein